MTLKPRTKVIARCAAKLNLTFEILGDLPGGYHEVETLLQAIDLEDEISFWIEPDEAQEIVFARYEPEVSGDFPLSESNLIAKAIRKFQDAVPFSRNHTVAVEVKKRIPIAAGVAGGSANAAAALIAMNEYFQSPLTMEQLLELGTTLGADVPFAICGGTQIGRHRGDKLEVLSHSPKLFFTIVKPRQLSISTPWAFKKFDQREGTPQASKTHGATSRTQLCVEAIKTEDLKVLSETLHNDLEEIVFNEYPDLNLLKQKMWELGAWSCRMTGSGPTLYALAADREHCHFLRRKLRDEVESELGPLDIWITESVEFGARIIPDPK